MQILRADAPDFEARWKRLCSRGSDEDESGVRDSAAAIVADVRSRGDEALLEYTRRFDGWEPESAAGPGGRSEGSGGGLALAPRGGTGRAADGRGPHRVLPPAGDRLGRPHLPRPARRAARPGVAPARPGRALRARRHGPLPVQRPHDRHPGPGGRRRRGGRGLPRRPQDRRRRRLDARRLPRLRGVAPLPRGRGPGGGGAGPRDRHGPRRRQDLRPGKRLRGGGEAARLRHGRHRHDRRAVRGAGARRREREPGRGRRRPARPGRARRARGGGARGDERDAWPGPPRTR